MSASLEWMKDAIASVNESKLAAGVAIIALNILTKHVELGLTDSQATAIKLGALREMLIFAMTFVATRDMVVSIILTASFTVLTAFLFNEESSLCVMPERMRKLRAIADRNRDGRISNRELESLRRAATGRA